MSQIYDNWERLVRVTLRREQLRLRAQRTPSEISLLSSSPIDLSASSRTLYSFKVPVAFEYDQILRATSYFSKSNLITHGHSGDLFFGVLDDGNSVVVKKIDLSPAKKKSYYVPEMQVLGKASHSRFVPLIGHCLDTSIEKFLVYKYMPNRDLSSCLFREINTDGDHSFVPLDWIARLKIATGIAEALCYLHHECIPPLVHRGVQASSILLDDNYEARLGSFSDVCAQRNETPSTNPNKITRFLRLPQGSKQGTSGSGQPDTNCVYDVYCFGKVLLALVTGEMDFSAAEAKDYTGKTLPYISLTEMELLTKIVDPALALTEDLLKEVWAVAIIAKACLKSQPSKRPLMTDVLLALQNPLKVVTRKSRSIHNIEFVRNKSPKQPQPQTTNVQRAPGKLAPLVTSNGSVTRKNNISEHSKIGVPKFWRVELEIACEDFANVIGFTAVGTLYKGILPNGVDIAVLSYSNDWSRKLEGQFREKIATLSKVNHRNFTNLLGYCEEEEPVTRMMVFEYVRNGSLFEHLRTSAAGRLDWEMRMRIVMGIAFCLKHMHQLTPPVVHKNLNSSEVYLTEDYAAKISDFGFWNEEAQATAELQSNLESNVYSFGVLLFEIITGRILDRTGRRSPDWMSNYLELGWVKTLSEMVDPTLCSFNIDQLERIGEIMKSCVKPVPGRRPTMREITARLRKAIGLGSDGEFHDVHGLHPSQNVFENT